MVLGQGGSPDEDELGLVLSGQECSEIEPEVAHAAGNEVDATLAQRTERVRLGCCELKGFKALHVPRPLSVGHDRILDLCPELELQRSGDLVEPRIRFRVADERPGHTGQHFDEGPFHLR